MTTLRMARFAALAVAAAWWLVGCESCGERCLGANRFNPDAVVILSSDLQREFDTPLYCNDATECKVMMERGAHYLQYFARVPIVVQTDTMLQSDIPVGSSRLSYRVTREARPDGRFQLMTGVACTLSGPCAQNERDRAARMKYFMRTGALYEAPGANTTGFQSTGTQVGNTIAQAVLGVQPPPTSVPVHQASTSVPSPSGVDDDSMMRDVIIYRDRRSLNSSVVYRVIWNGKLLGVVTNGGVQRIRLPAGPNLLEFDYRMDGSPNLQHVVNVADEGETFLFMRLHYSLSARGQMSIEAVTKEQALAAIAELAR